MQKQRYEEFKLRKGLIYLNHAEISPWPKRTALAVQRFAEENMLEGAFNHSHWLEGDASLRRQAQALLNAPLSNCIALLKNTSEALSVVAYGLDWMYGDNVVSSNQEFPSNRIVWESLSQYGVEFREAELSSSQSPEDALFSLVDTRTRLITISSVQFSTGLRMNLSRIGEFCKSHGILFCVDAIQSLGAVRCDVQEIKADFVMADGHKWMLGPEGLAVFYCHPEARSRLHLNQYGWHMIEDMGDFDLKDWRIAESGRRFECGSPNMMGIKALSASLSLLLEAGMEQVERDILKKSEYLFERINSSQKLELITSIESDRYAGIVTFKCINADPVPLYKHLSQHDVVCALRGGGIRFSPHFYIPNDHLEHAMDMVIEYMKKRSTSG
jgi:selenocysteine lyase/cysteine desulfurase